MSPQAAREPDRVLTMGEVKERLSLKGQGGLYRLIREDPSFVTFKLTDLPGSPRRMRESALIEWMANREKKERAA